MKTNEIMELIRGQYDNKAIADKMIIDSIDFLQRYPTRKVNENMSKSKLINVVYQVETMSKQENETKNKLIAKLNGCGYATGSQDEETVLNANVRSLCTMGMVTRPGSKVFMRENLNDKTKPYIIFIFTDVDEPVDLGILSWIFGELSRTVDNVEEEVKALENEGCKLIYDGNIGELPHIAPHIQPFTSTLVNTGMYLKDHALNDVMRWVNHVNVSMTVEGPNPGTKASFIDFYKVGRICRQYITEYNAVFQSDEFTDNPFSLGGLHASFDDILSAFIDELNTQSVGIFYYGKPLKNYKRSFHITQEVRREIDYISSCTIRNPQVIDDILKKRVNEIVNGTNHPFLNDLDALEKDEAYDMLCVEAGIIIGYIECKWYDQIGPILLYGINRIEDKYHHIFKATLDDCYEKRESN